MAGQRIGVRDYKRPARRGGNGGSRRWVDIGIGLSIGLVIALAVHFKGVRDGAPVDETPQPRADAQRPASEAAAEEPEPQYDFYDMLPRFEVVVPERDTEVRRDLPAARVERPGVYVLQAGSYRNAADAERRRAQLAKQGINASVQRVAVDADVWHRVRIGPVRDLNQVNRLRDNLRAADIDALVIRVGD